MLFVINTKGVFKNGQSREHGNIGYTKRRKTKQRHKTICVGHHNTQTNTNDVILSCLLLFFNWVLVTAPKAQSSEDVTIRGCPLNGCCQIV